MKRRSHLKIIFVYLVAATIAFGQADQSLVRLQPCPIQGWVCWLGDGDSFEKKSWTEDVLFDPIVAMPELSDSDTKNHLTWIATPSFYNVYEEAVVRFGNHYLRRTIYFCRDPSGKVFQRGALVFTWDYRPFCISFGEANSEHPAVSTDAILISTKMGTQLDVGLYMSGTGAFNTHALFDFQTGIPRMVSIKHGGRGH